MLEFLSTGKETQSSERTAAEAEHCISRTARLRRLASAGAEAATPALFHPSQGEGIT